jgi:hypothetical protein
VAVPGVGVRPRAGPGQEAEGGVARSRRLGGRGGSAGSISAVAAREWLVPRGVGLLDPPET